MALAFATDSRAAQEFVARQPVRAPWDTQLTAEAFIANRTSGKADPHDVRGGLVCDAMRMGKTGAFVLFAFREIQRRLVAGKPRFGRPFLVVGPSDVVKVWLDEIVATVGPDVLVVERVDTDSASARSVQYDKARLLDRLREQTDIIVTTYSTLSQTVSGIADLFFELEFAAGFFDEAHLASNEATDNYKALLRLRCDSKWPITGTPIQNDVNSLRAMLRLAGVPAQRLELLYGDKLVGYARQITLRRVPEAGGHIEMALVQSKSTTTPWVPRLRPIPVEVLDFALPIERALYEHLVRCLLTTPGSKKLAASFLTPEGNEEDNEEDQSSSSSAETAHGLDFTITSILQKCCLSPLTLLSDFHSGALTVPPGLHVPARHLFAVPPPVQKERVARDESNDARDDMDIEEPEETTRIRMFAERITRLALREMTYEAIGADPTLVLREEPDAETLRPKLDALKAHLLPPVSTKERWICRTLLTHMTDVTREKVLIFSQWYLPLAHLARLLELRLIAGVPHARNFVFLHGKMPAEVRDRERARFKDDPECGVMLSTLKTNTVGVDLTCANHVVLCDSSWNPMPEFQATSRVFGRKQTRPVTIYRLAIRNTIDTIIAERADSKVSLDGLLPMSLQDRTRDIQQVLTQTRNGVY